MWSPADWERFLGRELGGPVEVIYGRSRSLPIQAWPQALAAGRPGLAIRMHRMFGEAPAEVREALARWLRTGRRARRACERLDRWIHERLECEPAPPRRVTRLRPAGRHHHLGRLAAGLLTTEFARDFSPQRPAPGVTWGRRGPSRSRRSIRLGSYDLETHVVRVHPVLDQATVPAWVVRFVLRHELLHAALPPRPGPGARWIHHGPEFRAREAAHPDYRRAVHWEEVNLQRLIRAARGDKAFRPVGEGGEGGEGDEGSEGDEGRGELDGGRSGEGQSAPRPVQGLLFG